MSALDNLTIGEAKQLAAMVVGLPTNGAVTTPTNGDGRAVIVRSRDAGVLFGEFRGNDGSTVHLTNARQLWKWRAEKGGTMVDVATYGVSKSGNKFSPAQAKMTIFNACALIDCTAEAADSIVKMEGEKWV